MHGPWHMPEHPDEGDYSAQEREAEAFDQEELDAARERDGDEDDLPPEHGDGIGPSVPSPVGNAKPEPDGQADPGSLLSPPLECKT
jgi:hypothetical protein